MFCLIDSDETSERPKVLQHRRRNEVGVPLICLQIPIPVALPSPHSSRLEVATFEIAGWILTTDAK